MIFKLLLMITYYCIILMKRNSIDI